jgi:hypothetical protein
MLTPAPAGYDHTIRWVLYINVLYSPHSIMIGEGHLQEDGHGL